MYTWHMQTDARRNSWLHLFSHTISILWPIRDPFENIYTELGWHRTCMHFTLQKCQLPNVFFWHYAIHFVVHKSVCRSFLSRYCRSLVFLLLLCQLESRLQLHNLLKLLSMVMQFNLWTKKIEIEPVMFDDYVWHHYITFIITSSKPHQPHKYVH